MVDCGHYSCQPGNSCGSGGNCISQETVDCGRGLYCNEGASCWRAPGTWPGILRRGDIRCATSEQASQWNAKIAEMEQERREAARRKEEERRAEIARKKQEAEDRKTAERRKIEEKRETARRKERERLDAIARKKQDEIDGKRRVEEARKLAAEVEAKRKVEQAAQAAADKAAATKLAADKVAADRAAKDKAIADKAAAIKLATDKAAADKAAAAKLAADKVAADKAAKDKAIADKAAANKLAADKAAADKLAAAKAAADRLAAKIVADKAEAEKIAAARKATADQLAADKAAAAKAASDKIAAEKAAKDKAAADKLAAQGRPYLGAGQQAIDKAFTPDAAKDKTTADTVATPNRPYLGAGQQAIDRAFTSDANKAAAEQQAAVAAANKTISVSRADDYLRAVVNDSRRPQSDRQSAARALNDTPTFREIVAIGLGKMPEPAGTAAARTPVAPLTAAEIKALKDSAVTLSPSQPVLQPTQFADLWRKLETSAQGSTAAQKLPNSVQVAKGIDNLSQKNSASTFPTQSSAGQATLTPKLSDAERLAKAKIEAQQQAALYGLSIDRGTANRVLPYARLSQDAYSDKPGNIGVPNVRRVSDWETILKSGGYSDQQVAAFKRSGFSATVYRNDKTDEIVIAYRGTEPRSILGADGLTDLDSSIAGTLRKINPGYVSGQYQAAADLAQVVKQKWPAGTAITLTGHSLGGGLASYAGGQNNIPGVITFNAARNTFSTSAVNDKQLNIAVPGELIGDSNTTSGFGKGALPGQLYSVPSTKDRPSLLGDLLGAHGMDGLIGGLENSVR